MKAAAAFTVLLLAFDVGRLTVPTNSHAATERGTREYAKGDYRAAERAFREAARMRPDATTSFDLGTAQIAAGNVEEGSRALEEAAKDPALAADAFYNRGNSALQTKAFDSAIRDFEQALRLRPLNPAAKRNLEIALKRRQEQQQQDQQQGPQQKQQQQPRQSPGDQGEEQKNDAESLLRSVEQQEREELSRMRRSKRAEPRVGW